MRKLLCVIVLAACELQPAPKKQAATAEPAPAEVQKPVETPPAPPPTAAGPGSAAAPRIEVSAQCLQVGAKVAQVFIDSAADAGQKSIYEQERANMTRKTGEACTTQGWSEPARNCYLAAKTPADIKVCETKFPAPRPAPAAQPAAGSAAQPGTAPRAPQPPGVPPPDMQTEPPRR